MRNKAAIILCVCLGCAATVFGAGAAFGAAAAADKDILTTDSYWRWYVTLRRPAVPAGRGAERPRFLGVSRGIRTSMRVDHLETPPPPAGWQRPDFDDSAWPRSRANWLAPLASQRFSSSLLCLRGKFHVTDPRAVRRLVLSLGYRGGVVVHLNGKEVARGHMPGGTVRPETPAEPYPRDVYVDAKGKPIAGYWQRRKQPGKKDMDARIARRRRSLGPIRLPLDKLRRGTNVLAIELHRSDYDPVALSWFTARNIRRGAQWIPMALLSIRLGAAGRGTVPNISRATGLHVWVPDRNDRVTNVDYGDPSEKGQTIRVVGARNGSFCAQVGVSSTAPIRGLRADAADLKALKGGGVIPAAAVKVLYGRLDMGARMSHESYGRARPTVRYFDGLREVAPAEVPVRSVPLGYGRPLLSKGAVQLVFVRIRVPRDAPAGDYRGELTVSAAGAAPVRIPVELHVADWTVPDPKNYRTYVGIYQSPTSLALQYKVREWSEKHWDLMDKSFAILSRVGNKLVNVAVVEQTQFGNDRGMVYWIRKPGGTFDYDFSVFDRYMQLAKKHFGTLDYVALQVWHSGGWSARKATQKNTVTVLDRKTGRFERMQVPTFGTEESKRFWKPVLDSIRGRLRRLGMEKAMCLGILSDGTAPPAVFKAFDEIVPGKARWTRGLHAVVRSKVPYPLRGGGLVVLHEHCYGMGMISPRCKTLPPIWSYRGQPGTAYFRVAPYETRISLVGYRIMAEQALFCGKQGIGRICLDFWPVLGRPRSRGRIHIYNRYPHSSCAQRAPALYQLTWPGPNGAETTTRFEALCEGLQEAEAMIVISEAVDKHPARLGAALAAECRKVLRDRLWYCHTRNQQRWQYIYMHMNHHGWQDLSRRTFGCAAKVSRRLGAASSASTLPAPPRRPVR